MWQTTQYNQLADLIISERVRRSRRTPRSGTERDGVRDPGRPRRPRRGA